MATTQRERNAAQAREKMDARREDADGAAGWVAERAGQWDLEGVDDTFMDRQYDEVQQSLQDGMDALARRRTFPIFGWMVEPTTPVPVCTRPAGQDRHPPKAPVALPLFPFGVHRPVTTGYAHPGTAAADSTI